MAFEYSYYYEVCLLIPLFVTVVSGIFSIGFLIKPEETDSDRKKRIFVIVRKLIFVAIGVCFFSSSIGRLMSGGVYLLVEKPADAIEVTGTISEIKTLNRFIMMPTQEYCDRDSGEYTCYSFTVDGIEIKSFGKGKFQEGDEVTVLYLPKSRYLLSIAWVEETDSAPLATYQIARASLERRHERPKLKPTIFQSTRFVIPGMVLDALYAAC